MRPIDPEERITRFVYSRSHIGTNPLRVRREAFLPTPQLETSVSRTNGNAEEEIWSVGLDIAQKRLQVLRGRGDLKARDVPEAGLSLLPTATPPKHANIIGWSGTDKSADKTAAQLLANQASVSLYDSDVAEIP